MSTAANHSKRSHRSEKNKSGAFRASTRKAYYRGSNDMSNRSILSRLFRRKAPQQRAPREVEV